MITQPCFAMQIVMQSWSGNKDVTALRKKLNDFVREGKGIK